MIPKTDNENWKGEVEIHRISSETYEMDLKKNKIYGTILEQKAMEQAIYKILHTQRYTHVIYDGAYGVELSDLFGKPQSYVIPELQKRVEDALLADDRIEEVKDFRFSQEKNTLTVRFRVETIFGEMEGEKEMTNYV